MIELGIFLTLFCLGFFVGSYAEKQHYKSIVEREQKFMHLVTTSSKRPVGDIGAVRKTHLVRGNAVISVDYFKRIIAGLRAIVGGNVSSYETLLDRSRREAILRLKESCPSASQIINLRIETSSVFKGAKDQTGSVEILAYGTAIYAEK
ncbi:YbjQ family protein [Shewanella gelidii]|uniref:Metal-binding protein n=1 Tax=Shewanella gelidii TaxID=1642821 RepID=A0A917N9E8_9GAMM|nr:heavy metal-binding domain-containing protein [Shewanella gelidii]MCL1097380.1 YbjQ family protein [Shewanella gelidii]GGI74741.1 metal-binding protein [Shewanella gelidii]